MSFNTLQEVSRSFEKLRETGAISFTKIEEAFERFKKLKETPRSVRSSEKVKKLRVKGLQYASISSF